MEIGKLPVEQLAQLVPNRRISQRQDIIQTSQIGEDCGAIAFSDEICVVSTDPITATQQNIGFLAVHVACNDVFACGARCAGILVTLLAPPSASFAAVQQVMEEIAQNCAKLQIEVLGGHTEVTDAVNRILVSVTAIGKAKTFLTSGGARPGDGLVLTKTCGLEGTHILINDFADELQSVLTPAEIQEGKRLIEQISVAQESAIALSYDCHAMHDVTDGGLLGALYEMLSCSGCGAVLDLRKIPLLEITKKVCAHFHLDPYRLIGSGSLLICSSQGEKLVEALEQNGVAAAVIGQITEKDRWVIDGEGNKNPMTYTAGDELYRVYHRETRRPSCEV